MKKLMSNTLQSWRVKKACIIGFLVAVSVAGGFVLHFNLGSKLIFILVLFLIWLYGQKNYACPHCKTPIDLRIHLHTDIKCTKCGKSIIE